MLTHRVYLEQKDCGLFLKKIGLRYNSYFILNTVFEI